MPVILGPATVLVHAQGLLSVEWTKIGEIDRAIETIEAALAAIEASGGDLPPGFHRIRGLIYLRKAEVENCIARHNADCCIFPLARTKTMNRSDNKSGARFAH